MMLAARAGLVQGAIGLAKLLGYALLGALVLYGGFGVAGTGSVALVGVGMLSSNAIAGHAPGAGLTFDPSTGAVTTTDVTTLPLSPVDLPPGYVSPPNLYRLARAAGWTPAQSIDAVAISLDEDRTSDPNAISPPNHDGTRDAGLLQINSSHWAAYGGLQSVLVPQTNFDIGHALYEDAAKLGLDPWSPWSTYNDGSYQDYLGAATAAHDVVENASSGNGQYAFPLPSWTGAILPHWGGSVGGSDLMAPIGQPVVSVSSGTVIEAGWDTVGGNAVLVRGADGLLYYYAHFASAPLVEARSKVTVGQPIGVVGNTGDACKPVNGGCTGASHLHIGIGQTILIGNGPDGGTGSGFDAVTFLRQLYAASHGGHYP